jgi:uncharacterized protein YkwD
MLACMSRSRSLLVALALPLVCCASTATSPHGAGGAQEPAAVAGNAIAVDELDVTFSAPPAERYGEPVVHQLAPAEQIVVSVLTDAGLVHEPGLSKAARELARTAPGDLNIPASLVDGIMDWVGLMSPRPRVSVVEFDDPAGACTGGSTADVEAHCADVLNSIIEQATAAPLPAGPVDVGAGVAALGGGRARIVVAVSEQVVALDPVPVAPAADARVPLRGRLLGGRTRPVVEVVDGDGRAQPVETALEPEGAFSAEVVCSRGAGPTQVEVLAEGPYGTEVVANFRLHCGGAPPRGNRSSVERLQPGITDADVERTSFDALNESRRAHGLPELEWDEALAAVARAHSEDMMRSGFVGHRSPTTGLADQRLRNAGIEGSVVRENIARGYGPLGIHEGLMGSPGHRANSLAADVRRVGIGAVLGPSESDQPDGPRPIFLTQLFLAPCGADVPDEPVAALRTRVDESRASAGLPAIRWDDRLSTMAQSLAEGVAADRTAQAQRAYERQLAASPFAAVETSRTVANAFAPLAGLDLWRERLAGFVGLGLARVPAGPRQGGLVLVISVGRR